MTVNFAISIEALEQFDYFHAHRKIISATVIFSYYKGYDSNFLIKSLFTKKNNK